MPTCSGCKCSRKFNRLSVICRGGHPACRIWRHLAARITKPNLRHDPPSHQTTGWKPGPALREQPGMVAATVSVPERDGGRLPRNSRFHLRHFAVSVLKNRRCGEMADAQDLKSWDRKKSCGFESRHRHQPTLVARAMVGRPTFGIRAVVGRPVFALSAAKSEGCRAAALTKAGYDMRLPNTAQSFDPASQPD